MPPQERQQQAVQPAEVLPQVLLPDARLVLPISEIRSPMAAILDPSVAGDRPGKALHPRRQTAGVIARLDGLPAAAQAAVGTVAAPDRDRAFQRKYRFLGASGVGRLGPKRLQPVQKAGLKSPGVQQHQDPSKDVLVGGIGRQGEQVAQPILSEVGAADNSGRFAGAGQHGLQGGDHDADQRVVSGVRGGRVPQFGEKATISFKPARTIVAIDRSP
jgi:hypothetical protein